MKVLPGVFARALLNRSLFPLSRSFSFFLSFFSLPCTGAFFARAARARPLAPSFLLGSAERGGRQLSPPPSTRAPAEAAAALRAPTHSNMARAQGACARAPPHPRSSRQPAPLAPRAWRPPARPPQAALEPALPAGASLVARHPLTEVLGVQRRQPPPPLVARAHNLPRTPPRPWRRARGGAWGPDGAAAPR